MKRRTNPAKANLIVRSTMISMELSELPREQMLETIVRVLYLHGDETLEEVNRTYKKWREAGFPRESFGTF